MIRNIFFSLFFYIGIIFISIIFIPSLILPHRVVLFGGKLMGHWAGFCLRFFLSTKVSIKGRENILKKDKFFIAASHQSMFETFFLQTIFNSPVFILKNELLHIPVFGWYLKKIGSISIKRDQISKDNLSFFDDIKSVIKNTNRPVIIFPQATRVPPLERPQFKKGAARIYKELNIKCQPIAINSGFVWPKKGENKSHQEITVSILKPINPGLSKDDFIQVLEKNIYSELDLLN